MTTLLDEAVDAVRKLPPDEQEAIARLMIAFATGNDDAAPVPLSAEEQAGLEGRRGQRQIGSDEGSTIVSGQEVLGPVLLPGTPVRYDGSDEGGEFGIVVHCWMNEEIRAYDCYVAFFGPAFPSGRPEYIPYILRYASMHLTVLGE